MGMPEIPPELAARMDAYAERAAEEAPELTDEQIRDLRAALRMTNGPGNGGKEMIPGPSESGAS